MANNALIGASIIGATLFGVSTLSNKNKNQTGAAFLGREEPTFPDVSPEDWYYEPVMTAVEYGWLFGYPAEDFPPEDQETFEPDRNITRAEVAAAIVQAGMKPWERYMLYAATGGVIGTAGYLLYKELR